MTTRQDEEAELEEQERRDVSVFFGACLPGTDALDRNGWQGLMERPRGDGGGEGEVVVGGKADGAGAGLVRACASARHGMQVVVRHGKGGGGGGRGGEGAHVLGGKLEKEWDVLERWERRRQWHRRRDRAKRRDAGRAAEKKRERGSEESRGGGGGGRVLDEEGVYGAVCVGDWVSRRFCCGGSCGLVWVGGGVLCML